MKIKMSQLRELIRECCCDDAMGYPDELEYEMDVWESEGDLESPDVGRELGDGGSASMARGQLFNTAQRAQSLYDRLSDDDEIPEWVQSKITIMHDYMSTVDDYLSYEMHHYDEDSFSPRFESAHKARHRLVEEEAPGATVGKEVKGGSAVDKVKKVLDKIPALEPVLKQIDTKDELASLVQAIVTYSIETGGLDQSEVNVALTNAAASAKKG